MTAYAIKQDLRKTIREARLRLSAAMTHIPVKDGQDDTVECAKLLNQARSRIDAALQTIARYG